MSQPGARSRNRLALAWSALGLGLVGVSGWLGATRWRALLSGHPLTLIVVVTCGLVGLVGVLWAAGTLLLGDQQDREGDASHPIHRSRVQLARLARRRLWLSVPALVLSGVLLVVAVVSRPRVAEPTADAALFSTNGVRVVDRLGWYELQPASTTGTEPGARPTTGLVFLPGALVDPRAYAPVLRPLARAGYLIVVVKEPLGLSVLEPDHAETVLQTHAEISSWAIAGHSLGGVVAAGFAQSHPQIKGLALWASFPSERVGREDLTVVSIYGEADQLTTPADVDRSRPLLPKTTRYVGLPGAAHDDFGDYGWQRGAGTSTTPRADSQALMVQATQDLLETIAPPPPNPPG